MRIDQIYAKVLLTVYFLCIVFIMILMLLAFPYQITTKALSPQTVKCIFIECSNIGLDPVIYKQKLIVQFHLNMILCPALRN